jgi:hypothetical protein
MRPPVRLSAAFAAAGISLLAASTAFSADMTFRLERSFDVARSPDTGHAFANIYYLSLPLVTGLPDVADTGSAGTDKCVGTGAAAPDGIFNADDLLCHFWTSRTGGMDISTWDEAADVWLTRSAFVDDASGAIVFAGTWTTPIDTHHGFRITVWAPDPLSPVNPVRIVGWHDPSWTGEPITAGAKVSLLFFPYHALYQRADEVFCGLEGIDWVDVDPPIGEPDSCTMGVFDGSHPMIVFAYDDVAHAYLARSVELDESGALVFTGDDFDLRPGDSYPLTIDSAHDATLWLVPHF